MKRFFFLIILSATLVSACTSRQWVRTTVTEHHDFNIALEQQQENGQGIPKKFAHPYSIEISALEKLLGALSYVEKGGLRRKELTTPVFQTDEILRLSPALALALAKADANQRIRFTSFNQGDFWKFSISRKTEGVVFIEPAGRLNIAFNYINFNRQPSESSASGPSFSSVDPLQIRTSETSLAVTSPYLEPHEFARGKTAPMWVVADLEKLRDSSRTATIPNDQTAKEPLPTVRPAVGIKSPPVEHAEPGQAADDRLLEDIKNKLKYLKELFDEGLISETDYFAKRAELLEKIK